MCCCRCSCKLTSLKLREVLTCFNPSHASQRKRGWRAVIATCLVVVVSGMERTELTCPMGWFFRVTLPDRLMVGSKLPWAMPKLSWSASYWSKLACQLGSLTLARCNASTKSKAWLHGAKNNTQLARTHLIFIVFGPPFRLTGLVLSNAILKRVVIIFVYFLLHWLQ